MLNFTQKNSPPARNLLVLSEDRTPACRFPKRKPVHKLLLTTRQRSLSSLPPLIPPPGRASLTSTSPLLFALLMFEPSRWVVQETPAPTEQAIQSPAPQARSVWVGSFVTLGFRTSRLVVMAQPTRIGRQRNDRKTNNHSQAKERAILRGIGYLPGGQLSRSESATIPEPTGLATSALLLGFHPPEPLGRRLLVARGNLGQHRIQGSEQFWRKHRRRPSIRPQR